MKRFFVHHINEWVSPVLLSLSLALHIFNMGGGDGLKPFHFVAILACIYTLFRTKKDTIFNLLCLFLGCVGISAIVSPVSSTTTGFVTILIVMICCYGVSKVQLGPLLKCFTVFIPIDLILLMYEAISSLAYRFQGYYNDPNYLCTTLIVFFFLSILTYFFFDNKFVRLIVILDIVMIVVLILFTLSRTGLACILLLLIIMFSKVIRRHVWKGIIILFISVLAINHYAGDFIDKEYALLYERFFENSDNLESAGDLRSELSKQNLRFISDNPIYLFFGLGPGATSEDNSKQIPGLDHYRKRSSIRDHNTWTSCLSEYGVFALFFFIFIFGNFAKSVMSIQNRYIKKYSMFFFLSLIIFSLSLWQMTYLPFWWGLFLLTNKELQNA